MGSFGFAFFTLKALFHSAVAFGMLRIGTCEQRQCQEERCTEANIPPALGPCTKPQNCICHQLQHKHRSHAHPPCSRASRDELRPRVQPSWSWAHVSSLGRRGPGAARRVLSSTLNMQTSQANHRRVSCFETQHADFPRQASPQTCRRSTLGHLLLSTESAVLK